MNNFAIAVFTFTRFEPNGPVVGHENIKHSDLVPGLHLPRARRAMYSQSRARASSLSTVFQLRPVPRVRSLLSIDAWVSFERPIPAG